MADVALLPVLARLQRCSTSYVRLPPDYPKLHCSGRTPLAGALINDVWVSVTSGSEDYSFKVRAHACRLVRQRPAHPNTRNISVLLCGCRHSGCGR